MPAKLIVNGRVMLALVMFLIFTVMVAIALTYPPQARFMPLVVGLPGIALTLFELIREIRRTLRPELAASNDTGPSSGLPTDISRLIAQDAVPLPQAEGAKLSPEEETRRERVLLLYFTGLIAGILLFGFWIAMPVFIATFLRFHQKASWRFAILSALVTDVVLYAVFIRILGVQLHDGFITEWLTDIVFPGY